MQLAAGLQVMLEKCILGEVLRVVVGNPLIRIGFVVSRSVCLRVPSRPKRVSGYPLGVHGLACIPRARELSGW